MKPASFRYHAPKTIEEALAMLAEYAPDDGRVLAGGQSLVPTMAFRLARPHHLVDINGIEALRRLAVEDGKLVIGAGVRHQAFHRPVVEGPLGALLSAVMRHIAHYPIRTRGTFCGSLAHADPASEWCLVAATLGAEMAARSARGARIIAAADYFQGIMTTALEADELLAEVRLPILPAETRAGFYEFNRRAGDFRRRRAPSAAYHGGRSAARRPCARTRGFPRRSRRRSGRDRSAHRRADRRCVSPRACCRGYAAGAGAGDGVSAIVTGVQRRRRRSTRSSRLSAS